MLIAEVVFCASSMSVDYNETKEFRYRRKPRIGDGRPEFNTYATQRQSQLSQLLNAKPPLGEIRRQEAKEVRVSQRTKDDLKFIKEQDDRRKEREQRRKRLETIERRSESRTSRTGF